MTRDIYNVKTPADIRKIGQEEDVQVLADLGHKLRYPASEWTYKHLIAYQLQIVSEKDVLETFAADYTVSCPILRPDSSPQRVNQDRLHHLLQELRPEELLAPESELLLLGPNALGPFKVALAQARNVAHASDPDGFPPSPGRPARVKQSVSTQHGFVNSSEAIDGSSPQQPPSSSSFEQGESDIDDDKSEERSGIQEEVAVRLLIEFTRYVLQCVLEQPKAARIEVRPRIERWSSTAAVGSTSSSGQDDGGISLFQRVPEGWIIENALLASFEAKRAQKLHLCYRTNRYNPIVSNAMLAQNLGEAVLGWRANSNMLGKDFFLIAASNTFIQFCHYEFGADYGAYLDAPDEQSQKALIDDETKDTMVRLYRSRPFNLELSTGRKSAARHILCLLRRDEQQRRQRQQQQQQELGADAYDSDDSDDGDAMDL